MTVWSCGPGRSQQYIWFNRGNVVTAVLYLGQHTHTGRYRSSSHQEDCCLPHGTHTTNDRRQTPTVPSPSRGRASCAQSRRSTRLQAAAADCGSGKTVWQTCQHPSKWDWRWPTLCRLDLERNGSVGEPLTDCGQGWAVQKQWWGDGAISTPPIWWIATAGSHRRWPTSSPAVY